MAKKTLKIAINAKNTKKRGAGEIFCDFAGA